MKWYVYFAVFGILGRLAFEIQIYLDGRKIRNRGDLVDLAAFLWALSAVFFAIAVAQSLIKRAGI